MTTPSIGPSSATPTISGPSGGIRPSRKLRGNKPKPFRRQPLSVQNELCFGMKPPPCIVSLRKKVRNLKRKRRTPYSSILVGAFVMRLEAQAVKTRPPKKLWIKDRIKQSSRLESAVAKLAAQAKKAASSANGGGVKLQIGAWQSSNSTNHSSKKAPNALNNVVSTMLPTGTVTKVKSELCPVTETCTAATLPPPTPSNATPTTPKHQKVKAEKTVSLGMANLLMGGNTPGSVMNTPSSAKTLPITPTFARIKREGPPINSPHGHAPHSELSLISPDLNRVKMEISQTTYNPYRQIHPPADMPRLPTSPHPMDVRDGHFISPRKRSMMREFENGSPSIKRHRVSTDSRGSSSEGGGAGSPASSFSQAAASPPRPNNGRVNPFSIDSIMSSNSPSSNGPTTLHRPVAIPASPVSSHLRTTPSKSPARSLSPPPAPQPIMTPISSIQSSQSMSMPLTTTPLVSIQPYQSRNIPTTPIDPRLAHLAGVAAHPGLKLTPTFSPAVAAAVMNYNNTLAAAAHYAQAAQNANFQQQLMMAAAASATPPMGVVTTSSADMPVGTPSILSSNGRSSVSRQSSGNVSSPPPSAAATPTPRPFSPWGLQYRGEPTVATPPRNKSSELQTKHPSLSSETDGTLLIKSGIYFERSVLSIDMRTM